MLVDYATIDQIISKNRLLQILYKRITDCKYYDEALDSIIKGYTSAYIDFQGEAGRPDKIYKNYIRSYNKDMVRFEETGKYPYESEEKIGGLERYDYNIVLLFSCLFAAHRFRIMQLIQEYSLSAANGLFIGCGPGLEIELVKSKIANLYAYDLSIDNFLLHRHSKVNFKETYFTSKVDSIRYDSIYLIELLEHLSSPYDLLEDCQKTLTKNGKIYLTTATNIPQFDHLYNFESSHQEFEKEIHRLGFSISFMEDIPHQAMTIDIGAANRFYILTQNS